MRLKRGTLPVVMLVVIVAWALTAVALLTGTLLTAGKINNRVGFVNAQVNPIDEDLDSVQLAVETGRIAGEINEAAKPLDDQLAQVITFGDGIEVSAASIAQRAGEINGTAKAINGTAKAINATATSINSTVGQINSNVGSIGSGISSINRGVASVNTSVDQINGSFDAILAEAISIDEPGVPGDPGFGAAGINLRADVVIGLSRAIKTNTEDILEQAVAINENAEEITESPLIIGGNGGGILGGGILDLNQRAGNTLPVPAPAVPGGAPGTDSQQPSANAPEAPALPLLPEVVPGSPTPAAPLPDAPKLLPDTGLLGSSGSDSGNLLGALG